MNARSVVRYLTISPSASWEVGSGVRPIIAGMRAYRPVSTSALTARRTRMLQCAHSVMRGKTVAQNVSSAMLNTRSHGTRNGADEDLVGVGSERGHRLHPANDDPLLVAGDDPGHDRVVDGLRGMRLHVGEAV